MSDTLGASLCIVAVESRNGGYHEAEQGHFESPIKHIETIVK